MHPRTMFASRNGWKIMNGKCYVSGRSKSRLFARAHGDSKDWQKAVAYRHQIVAGLDRTNLRIIGSLGHCNVVDEDATSSCLRGANSSASRLVPEGRCTSTAQEYIFQCKRASVFSTQYGPPRQERGAILPPGMRQRDA